MDYLVKIRSVQTPLNGQFSIGANRLSIFSPSEANTKKKSCPTVDQLSCGDKARISVINQLILNGNRVAATSKGLLLYTRGFVEHS